MTHLDAFQYELQPKTRLLLDLLYLHLAELLQFPAEPERREEGVLAGERNQRGARQRFVDV